MMQQIKEIPNTGQDRAIIITSDQVSAYVAFRKREGAANATINRELTALRRTLRLGKRAGNVGDLPFVSPLQRGQRPERPKKPIAQDVISRLDTPI